ncbi:hypothetical protein [Defluviimonas sp. SAOS-178_SWC]|uniref:hypothetical protein n=1 Tax=Defluviimonas sp. SAOS-178_SWC TaxID=3121287 RepID=UPI0032216A8A
MKTKIVSRSASAPVRTTPLLPWEVATLGASTEEEPRLIGAQSAVYHIVMALSAVPDVVRAAGAKMKRAGMHPRVPGRSSDDQTDRQMYFISR